MSDDPEARLAYGITLYSGETARVAEVGEYGELTVDWYDSDADGGFSTQLLNRLYDLIPGAPAVEYDWQKEDPAVDHWGVNLVRSGTWDYAGHILVATRGPGEPLYESVEWSEVMELDLDQLAHEDRLPDWSARIAAAIAALGITPTQTKARWLVFPFYG